MKPRHFLALARRADMFKALEKLFPRDEAKAPKPQPIKARTGRWAPDWGPRPASEIPLPANDDTPPPPTAA